MISATAEGSIAAGHVVDDRYVVESVLAEGGMGLVVLAHHKVVHHRVALKIILRSLLSNPDMLARFEREARLTNEIDHPGFVRTLDYGLDEGRPYFVMEYLCGMTVGASVRRDGPMPVRRVLQVLEQVADALQAAHEYGIVHRDVKPENVFLCEGGGVKLLDLGVAKFVQTTGPSTRAGVLLGTPHTMSPEQCRGVPLDPRSDIYALAVTAYYMCTGHFPFEGSAGDVMLAHVRQEPPRLDPHIGSPGLTELIARNLAKDPEDRMQSMREVGRALHAIANSVPDALDDVRTIGRDAETPLHGERQTLERRRRSDRRPTAWLPIAMSATLLGAGTLVLWLHDRPVEQPRPEAAPVVVSAPVSAQGRLAIVTDPHDAQVSVDGEPQGPGPVVVQGPLGRRVRIEAMRAGYQPLKRELTLAERDTRMALRMEKIRRPLSRGTVEVTDSWAAVYVDGRHLGEAPLDGLSLTPGVHRFTLVDAGRGFPEGSPFERTVIVRPGRTETISLASRDE